MNRIAARAAPGDGQGSGDETALARLLLRARSEFLEMPGLHLTPRQAARLWALDGRLSSEILQHLVQSGFLCETDEGAFVLRTSR